nr:hypothetical protein [Candidatus Sigynarchaeota archaeon]
MDEPGDEWTRDSIIEKIVNAIIERRLFTKEYVLERIRERIALSNGMLEPVMTAMTIANMYRVKIPSEVFEEYSNRVDSFPIQVDLPVFNPPVIIEYHINKHLSLRLVDNDTCIYVDGHRFDVCKRLILSLPVQDDPEVEQIDSIDAVVQKYPESRALQVYIPPETEFWGHCSNIQAWYEHGYDTRILHSNLAFPLLKRLADAGDEQARLAFK